MNSTSPAPFNLRPAIQMCGVTVFDGAMPLLLLLSLSSNSPLLFGIVATVGLLISVSIYNTLRHRSILRAYNWRDSFREQYRTSPKFRRSVWYSTAARLDWPMYAIAAVYLNATLIAIILGIVPLLNILNLAHGTKDNTGRSRYRDLTAETLVLVAIAFGGLALTVLSTSSEQSGAVLDARTVAGLAIALLAALFQGLGAYNIPLGIELAEASNLRGQSRADQSRAVALSQTRVELAATLVGVVITTLRAIPILILLFVVDVLVDLTGTRWNFSLGTLGAALVAGGVLTAGALILFRVANLESVHLGINAIGYFIPVAGLGILGIADVIGIVEVGNVRIDYLAIGTLAIVSVNLLLNIKSEVRLGVPRHGFRSLVLSVLLFGSFVYCRDQIIGTERLSWDGQEYVGLLALSATVFTLILAFRVTRLNNRIDFEDKHTISLFRSLELLIHRGLISARILDHVRRIDTAVKPEELAKSYEATYAILNRSLQSQISRGGGPGDDAAGFDPIRELSDAQTEVDILVQSRQHGREFSEILAVVLFAGLTVGLSLMVRPDDVMPVIHGSRSGLTGFVIELFCVLFASIITFLMFNLLDMRRERKLPLFLRSKNFSFLVSQREESSRLPERVVAVAVGVIVTGAFGILLYYKWTSPAALVW